MKKLEGYYNNYSVSAEGDIFSKNGKLKPQKNNNGYYRVVLCKNGVTSRFYLHRLIAVTFIPNPENKPCVNHINGIKTDNRVENLEWVNHSENNKHAFDLGLKQQSELSTQRTKQANSKKVIDNNSGKIYNSAKEASELTGHKYKNLTNQLNGNRKNKTNLQYV
jgi:hypothetical protein